MYLLEGNIAVGKTTLLSLLPRYRLDVELIPEPQGSWNQSIFGQSLLANFYRNPHRWAYTLELQTLICRTQDHMREQRKQSKNRLLERSVYSGHYCFAKTGYKNRFLSNIEWKAYNKWADFLLHKKCLPPQGFIYLRANPSVCFERVQKRNTPAERTITLEYLKQIHKAHEQFFIDKTTMPEHLKYIPVLVLDCSKDFLKNRSYMDQLAANLQLFFKKKEGCIYPARTSLKQSVKNF